MGKPQCVIDVTFQDLLSLEIGSKLPPDCHKKNTFSDFSVFSVVLRGAVTTAIALTEHLLLLATGDCAALNVPIGMHCIAVAAIAARPMSIPARQKSPAIGAYEVIESLYASAVVSAPG